MSLGGSHHLTPPSLLSVSRAFSICCEPPTANRQTWREIPSSSLPTNHNLVDFTQSYPVQSIHPPSRPSSLSDCWSDLLGRAISLVSLFRLSFTYPSLPFPFFHSLIFIFYSRFFEVPVSPSPSDRLIVYIRDIELSFVNSQSEV